MQYVHLLAEDLEKEIPVDFERGEIDEKPPKN
jgi:hypothetical protein